MKTARFFPMPLFQNKLACRALSIRQPWAWLIANGFKDIENRKWATSYRGEFYIHAGKAMDMKDYLDAARLIREKGLDVRLPRFWQLDRGGIVGSASIADCVSDAASPWFFGPQGFVIESAKPLPFQPVKGQLGFFWPQPLCP